MVFPTANASRRVQEENRIRRLSNCGADEVLIRVANDKESIGKAVAAVIGEQYYQSGKLGHLVDNRSMAIFVSIMFFFMTTMGASIPYSIFFHDNLESVSWFLPPVFGLFPIHFNVIAGVAVGTLFLITQWGYRFEQAPASLSEGACYIAVTIKRYDSSGYRNYKEETIYKVYDALKPLGIIKAVGIDGVVGEGEGKVERQDKQT